MNYKLLFLALLSLPIIFLSSCSDDDDPVIPNEEELITTLIYTLTPTAGGTAVVLTYRDLDGDGGNAPVITGGTLTAGASYTGAIQVLNESETPAEDITAEVQEEDEDHQFFFGTRTNDVLDYTITYTDQDADGNPVGLSTTLTAGAAGSGALVIILKHEPTKTTTGTDPVAAGGETDIEVDFPVTIQ